MEKKLGELRREIDSIDEEILDLILKRMHCVEKVGELKGKKSLKIYVPERENSIFQRLYNQGIAKEGEEKISREEIENIYTEIISFCRSKERKVKIFAEDNNCFFIAGKIFGSCIEIDSYIQDIDEKAKEKKREENENKYDFKILKFSEERYSEIFSEKTFKYITLAIDFSGESYIILGKAENGRGAKNFTGFLISDSESSKVEFLELEGFSEDEKVQKDIAEIMDKKKIGREIEGNRGKNIEIKIVGSYEKRDI